MFLFVLFLQPRTFAYLEPGIFQIAKQLLPFDDLVVDPATVIERFFEYFNAMRVAVQSNLGADIRRTVRRADQVVTAHIEYLISRISAVLVKSPSLSDGLTPEGIAEVLLTAPVHVESQGSVRKGPKNVQKDTTMVNRASQSKQSELLEGSQFQPDRNDAVEVESMRATLAGLAQELRTAISDVTNLAFNDPPPLSYY